MARSNDGVFVPPQVENDPAAEELIRAWRTKDTQVFSVRSLAWDEPATWGLLLADLARHIARSYAEAGSRSEQAALERLLAGWKAELE